MLYSDWLVIRLKTASLLIVQIKFKKLQPNNQMKSAFTLSCLSALGLCQQKLFNPHKAMQTQNGFGAIQVKEDGVEKTLYITPQCSTSGDHTDCPHNARATLSATPNLDPHGFYKPKLVGGSVEYDVDLSQMKCGCVAAFYTVALPAIGSDGNPHNTDGYYYCDANNITGEWCPEFDIMEANQFSWRTTPHTCDGSGPHYNNCDRGGNAVTDLQQKGVLGPGRKIDTHSPFHVKIEFEKAAYTLTVTQNGQSDVSRVDNGYINGMCHALDGNMAFILSSWSSDDGISWLQHGACGGRCDNNPHLAFSNLEFHTGSDAGCGGPGPGDWVFGDACASKSDDYCDGSCDCRWSWPRGGTWSDPNAACRCA